MKNFKKINWKRMLLENWVLKLASLTVAFVLWFVVVTIDDPIDDKTFYNVKVNLLNTKKLTDAGMVIEVLDGTDTLRSVTFEAPKSVLDMITAGDIIAEANLDNLTLNNTVQIDLYCPKYSDVTDLDGNIEFVKLNIEEKLSKWIDIENNTVGEVAEGYMIGNVTLDRNRLEIEGPASKVNQIAKAVVDVNTAEINSDISTSVDVYFLSKEGKPIGFDAVNQNVSSVTAKVDVLKIKEVPVEYIPIGEVSEDYLATGVVEGTPLTVKIAGNQPAINEFSRITISDALDMTGATESLVKEIDLAEYLPSGIVLADEDFDGKANVTVYVEDKVEKSLQLRRNNIQIVGAPENMMAQVLVDQEMPRLYVSGLAADMASLAETTLAGRIDVSDWMKKNRMEELAEGIYLLPVEFRLEEGQKIEAPVYIQVQFSLVVDDKQRMIETDGGQ